MKERGELPNEEGDAVRKKQHMKNISGAIGQGKTTDVKKKEQQKPIRMWKKRVIRGKGERRERNGGGQKEDVRFLFLWWLLNLWLMGRSGE